MAPEALLQGKFTIESDIWSYGVLLWEIMTLGNQPYPGRTNQEVLQFVTGGERLERPDNCPSRLYKVMQCCWKKYASERPHFTQIVSNFLDHVNNKRDSYCSDDEEEDIEEALQRRPSRPSRSSSARSFGLLSLARQCSMRIRNSLRRRSSLHRKEELDSHANDQNHTGMNSEEDLINDDQFRERGPF